jgi:hypothetical protein
LQNSDFKLADKFSLFPQKELLQIPGTARRSEYCCRHKQGRWVAMEVQAANRLGEPSIEGIVLNIRGITESREAGQERSRLQEQLQHAMKMEAIGRLSP